MGNAREEALDAALRKILRSITHDVRCPILGACQCGARDLIAEACDNALRALKC